MDTININSNLYALSVAQTSVNTLLSPLDANCTSLVIYNSGANPVFVVSAKGTAATAAIPTTGNKAPGKMIAPGSTVTFIKKPLDNYISAISGTGTNIIYISVGSMQ